MGEIQLTAKQRFWLEHVERCAESGQSMRAYAQAHDLDVQRFYNWKAQLAKRAHLDSTLPSPAFTEVQLHGVTVPGAIQVRFPNGCVLESRGLDEASLRTLCAALLNTR